MKIGLLAITAAGRHLAARLAGGLAGAELVSMPEGVGPAVTAAWRRYEGLVCIMAAGIAVRAVAPLLESKHRDPGVVVVDEQGRHAVSLLSGHLGGGNELARRVAALCGGQAVITTASDLLGLTPLDLWAAAQELTPAAPALMTRAAARLVHQGGLRLYTETGVAGLPPGLTRASRPDGADLVISSRTAWPPGTLLFHPRELVLGIGCNRGTSIDELEEAVAAWLAAHQLSPLAVRNLASLDLKRDEEGLLTLARHHGWPLVFYSAAELNRVAGITPSPAVLRATGAGGVAEPAALLSSGNHQLSIRKQKWRNVTLAMAKADFTLSARVLAARST